MEMLSLHKVTEQEATDTISFRLDIRGGRGGEEHKKPQTFTIRAIKHWNTLSREMVESPLLGIFKTWLDRASQNLTEGPAVNQKLYQMISRCPFQPRLFYNWIVSSFEVPDRIYLKLFFESAPLLWM